MSISPYRIKLTTPKIESLLFIYYQNIILDYKVEILDLPQHERLIEISKVIADNDQFQSIT